MSQVMYILQPLDVTVTDGQSMDLWLHDLPNDMEELRVQALAASGDYFETLAARLEQIAAALPARSGEQHQLQDAVGQLLYLQRNYAILKKTNVK